MTVRTRSAIKTNADTNLADNTTQDISPMDVRDILKDLADSAIFPEDGVTLDFRVKAGVTGNMLASYNMTSVTDDGVGLISGTIATDFASADWCGQVSLLGATTNWNTTNTSGAGFTAQAAGTFSCAASQMTEGGTAAANPLDPTAWFISGFGA